jgi:hypothetical protein
MTEWACKIGWNDIDRGKTELSVEKFVPVSPFHDQYNMHWADIEPGLPQLQPNT